MPKQEQMFDELPAEIRIDLSLQTSTRIDGTVCYRCGCSATAGRMLGMCLWHTRLLAKHREIEEGL